MIAVLGGGVCVIAVCYSCGERVTMVVLVWQIFALGQVTDAVVQSFRREVFVMNCLRHPNVVLMMGASQESPKLAILMEYVSGGSLYKVPQPSLLCAWPPAHGC